MRLHHVIAYRITGIRASTVGADITILDSDALGLTVLVTADPSPHLYQIDRGLALATLMLSAFAGQTHSDAVSAVIEKEVKSIQAHRAESTRGDAVLVVEIQQTLSAHIRQPTRDFGDFLVCFDAIDKEDIKRVNTLLATAAVASLHLGLRRPEPIEKLREDMYLVEDSGKVIYSFTPSFGRPRFIVSSPLTEDLIISARDLTLSLAKAPNLSKVTRLLVESLDTTSDEFRAFVAAWTALEIFVNTTFKEYETKFIEELRSLSSSRMVQVFTERVTDVMSGKYTLADKFNIVSHFLGGESAEGDRSVFIGAKNTRDRLFHGDESSESSLPTASIQALLLKYIEAHLLITTSKYSEGSPPDRSPGHRGGGPA